MKKYIMTSIIAIYSAIIISVYIFYLNPVWGYQGFPEFDWNHSGNTLILSLIFVMIFPLIYPIEVKRYSNFIVWFIYLYIYTTSIIIVSMQGIPDDGGLYLVIYLSASFYMMAYIPEVLSSAINVKNMQTTIITKNILQIINRNKRIIFYITTIFIILLITIFISNRDILSIRGFYSVYEQRAVASDNITNSTYMAYLIEWTTRVFSTFFITIYLFDKKKIFLFLGVAGFTLYYSIVASKYVVFLFFLMLSIRYFVIRNGRIDIIRFALLMIFAISVPFAITIYNGNQNPHSIDIIISQILKRAFGINGLTIGIYFDYFMRGGFQPFTYYSHLGPVRWFIDYPFGHYSIGQIVGHFKAGKYEYNASAGFWATDGIAALGYTGILIIGLINGIIFFIFDIFTKRTYLPFLCLSSVISMWMIADTSIFRALMTGGWPIHIILVNMYYSYKYVPWQNAQEVTG